MLKIVGKSRYNLKAGFCHEYNSTQITKDNVLSLHCCSKALDFGQTPAHFTPAALEGVYLLETFFLKPLCRPGTSCLVRSGTIQDKGFLPGVFVGPRFIFLRVFMYKGFHEFHPYTEDSKPIEAPINANNNHPINQSGFCCQD